MNKLKQLPARHQLIVTFGILCLILLAIGGVFFFSLRSIERSNQLQQSRVLHKLALIDDTAQDVGQMQAGVLREVLQSEPAEIKNLDQSVRDTEKINAKELADYRKFIDTEKQNQLYDRMMQARESYWEQTTQVLTLGLDNRDSEATTLINSKQASAYDEYLKAINDLIADVETQATKAAAATAHFILKIRIMGDALVGLAIAMVIVTGLSVVGIGHRLRQDNILLQTEIAERKRAEETLRESEEKFRQLAENISDVFWMTSANLDKILYVSPAYELIWGRPMGSLYADPHQWVNAILPDDRDRVFEVFSSLQTNQSAVSVEYQIARPDGTLRWIHDRGFQVLDADGGVIRLAGIASDITDRKNIEIRMFQSQKMETVGKLAGGVAHEFNSILTAIIGQSELLLTDLPPDNPLVKNAREIRQAADRAATLTRQLLAYGRKQILQPEIMDLNLVLTDMLSTLQHLLGREVDVRIVPSVDLKKVKIDPGQMEQVIVNIAMNAAAAMPNGGKFILETANVTLDENYVRPFPGLKPGGYVMLAMTDTGTGMSDEVKTRVFEPFFSTKSVGQGTGLGLATCYGILKQSDGHINVYSEIARGSTFKIYLPQFEQPAKASTSRLVPSDLPQGTETILLVEDDPSLLEMSASFLRRLGYTVLTAVDGVEALNLKNQRDIGHIDLLFTDVVMPHMSGKELADRIRAIYPRTKILFASAYTESAVVHQGVLNEGVVLLQKPFTPSVLANKVREVLDQPTA